jgi:TRAP-type C4-dicarboxylate transport system substrate-binding protein
LIKPLAKEDKKMKFKMMTVFICIMALALGISFSAEESSADTINIKISSPWPPKHPQHLMVVEPWMKQISELTGGRVKFNMISGQALGKAKDHYEMAVKGIADITLTVPAYTPGRFQLTSVFWLPFMVTSAEATSVALWKMYEKYFQEEYKDVKVLWHYVHAPGQIFTRKKPVKNLAELKGMKIRATNPYVQKSIKVLGASPVAIPVPEVYNALDRGVVDGTAMPFEGIWVFKQHEVVDYATICDLYTMSFAIVMNNRKWESLPADIKKIIDENIGLKMSRKAGIVYDKGEAMLKKKVLEYGIKANDLAPSDLAKWKEEGKMIRAGWAKEMESKGLPGNAVLKEAQSLLGLK